MRRASEVRFGPQNYFRHSEPAETSLSILTSLQSHAEVPRIHPLFGRGGDVPKGARGEALRPIFGAGTLSLGANNFNRLRVGAFPLAAGGEGTGGLSGQERGRTAPDAPGHARAPSQVRGGGAVGPITEDFGMGLSRTLAGVSIGSAVLEKYAGAASTTLSSAVSGDVFTTNAAIVFASYVTGIIAGDHFKAVDVAASLWIASVVLKLKDAGVDADSIQSNIVNIAVAAVMGVVAFTD